MFTYWRPIYRGGNLLPGINLIITTVIPLALLRGGLSWNGSDGAWRHWRFAVAAVVLSAVSLPAAESSAPTPAAAVVLRPPPDGARIQFAESTHDFGPIKRGDSATHTFVFTNTGNAMLQIMDVQVSCGCTTAGAWSRQVLPGQTGRIPILLATAALSGAIGRTISVISNDPLQPSTVLHLSATVLTPVEVMPATALFQFTPEATNRSTQTVRILNHQPASLIVEEPLSTNAAFRAELRIVQPGQEWELVISSEPPPGTDTVSGVISMRTSSLEMPLLYVQAHAMKQPAVVLSPTQVVLPGALLPAGLNSSVTIMGLATNPLVLSEPKLSFTGPVVQLRELQPGRLFSLSVAFPAGFALPQDEAAELTVKSNYAKFPVIRIPITSSDRAGR